MIYKSYLTRVLFVGSLIFTSLALIAQPSSNEGKTLFRTSCGVCHAKNMKDPLTGPALGGTEERWADYPREDLYSWIRNSQAQIVEGHPKAVELWNEWSPVVMQPFENLTDDQIESILLYVNEVFTGAGTATTATDAEEVVEESSNKIYYWLLIFLLIILVFALNRVIGNLGNIIKTSVGERPVERPSLLSMLTNKSLISFVIFALIVLAGYTTVKNGSNLGRQHNYQPDQPIKYSHETHAGINQIDCKFCHDGARRSRHAVIPSANTCMSCHEAIKTGTEYGTAELTKLFVAAGFDPNTNTYIENYDQLETEEIEAIMKKWIGDQYQNEKDIVGLDREGNRVVNDQWDHIVSSLTNNTKSKLQGPIEWIRVHNLPDHVYFNHAQHVSVGKIECQECHGKIEEMPVVKQYAPLSMGWCVNCHRQTEVSGFGDNNYYLESYKDFHEQITNGQKNGVTVEEIGGLECQKCHY